MSFFVERNIRTERLEITMITVNAMDSGSKNKKCNQRA